MSVTANSKLSYTPRGMHFRRLGPSGLRVPLFSLGSWLTMGGSTNAKDLVKTAFENGINMFDTSENYGAEEGRVVKELGIKRSGLVIVTKLFYGSGDSEEPNAMGLSRKHIVEGIQDSLGRLQMDYVDVVFAHRKAFLTSLSMTANNHMSTVSMEEIVRAFNFALYCTSEWPARGIQDAHNVASRLNLIGPSVNIAEPFYSMFGRERPEIEYAPLYKNYGTSLMTFSSLHMGLLTGKYNDGIPSNSRLSDTSSPVSSYVVGLLGQPQGQALIAKVKELTKVAEEDLGTTMSALALAWVAKNPNTATVILGASRPEQILENFKALQVLPKLTPEIVTKIEEILGNKPEAPMSDVARLGETRSGLDPLGRT
ncbi:Aldo/keto reductase [Mucidula mucida]|nr:Aldo/keto reductase [Mucidula mucida]